MKAIFTLLCLLLTIGTSFAQSLYTLSAGNAAYMPLSGATSGKNTFNRFLKQLTFILKCKRPVL
jgi:hypothetical protein